jgi:hypothetical protein
VNGAQVSAWFAQNKPVVLGVGAAGVVAAGLVARKRSGGDVSSSTPAGGYSAGGQTAGGTGGVYDSTSTDLYGAMSGELSGIAQSLAQMQANPPTPLPAPPKPTSGLKAGFYRKGAESNVYQVNANGTIDWLTQKEFRAIAPKGAKVQAISADNPVWQNGDHWLDASKKKPPTPAPVPAQK